MTIMIDKLLINATTPQMGSRISGLDRQRTFQATLQGVGPVTAKVVITVSNDLLGWCLLGTIDLDGTDMTSGGFASQPMWEHVRAELITISGTNAKVTVSVGHP